MQAIDKIQSIPFNHVNIKEYFGCDKLINGSRNELVFELTRDMADPTKDYFPFLFYSKVAFEKYEIFWCFMNVE